jgi:hypothetical protein
MRRRARGRGWGPAPCARAESRKAGSFPGTLGLRHPKIPEALRSFCFRHERPTPLGSISDYNGGPCNQALRLRNLYADRGRERRDAQHPCPAHSVPSLTLRSGRDTRRGDLTDVGPAWPVSTGALKRSALRAVRPPRRPRSKPGNGDAACGNDAASCPEHAQPCCALRPVPGLRRHSTASARVL